MKIDKDFIATFPDEHPAVFWVFLVTVEFFITELLSKFWEVPYRVYLFLVDPSAVKSMGSAVLENDSLINIDFGLRIAILAFFGIATGFFVWRRKWKIHFCNLKAKIAELQRNADELADRITEERKKVEELNKKDAPYKDIRNMVAILSDFTEKSEVVDSMQLFECTPLPDPEQISPDQMVEIGFRFCDGTASSKANVNVLYNICYQLPGDIYVSFAKLLECRRKYFSERKRVRNTNTEKDIQTDAIKLFGEISMILNDIKDISQISDQHYVLYRILEVLATMVIASEKRVSCQQLLHYQDGVESQLKVGMRTGMLGAYLLQTMYCFANENSIYKRGRSYFATTLEYNSHKLMLLAVLQRDKLRIDSHDDELGYCKKVYDEVESLLRNGL